MVQARKTYLVKEQFFRKNDPIKQEYYYKKMREEFPEYLQALREHYEARDHSKPVNDEDFEEILNNLYNLEAVRASDDLSPDEKQAQIN